jgi:hypothetical protein
MRRRRRAIISSGRRISRAGSSPLSNERADVTADQAGSHYRGTAPPIIDHVIVVTARAAVISATRSNVIARERPCHPTVKEAAEYPHGTRSEVFPLICKGFPLQGVLEAPENFPGVTDIPEV